MKCQSCARDYADTATFCPFCGAVPQRAQAPARPGAAASPPRPAAPPKPAEPQAPDYIDADQRTVAFDVSRFNFDADAGPETAQPAAPVAPVAEERTVAMQVPPGDEPPVARSVTPKRSATVIGMPGIGGGPGMPRAPRPGMGAAMQAGLSPKPAEPEAEKTLAFDPSRLGLDDDRAAPSHAAPAPAPEPEPEKTLAIDPAKLGLLDRPAAAAEPEPEKTLAIDPAKLGLLDRPAAPAAAQPETSTGSDDWMQKYTTPPGNGTGAPTGGAPRPAAPAKKGGKGLLIAILAIVVLGGAAAAAWFLMKGGGAMGGAAGAAAKQNLPRDVDVVFGADGDAIRSSWLYDEALVTKALAENREVAKLLEAANVKPGDLASLTVGAKVTEQGPQMAVVVGGKFDADKLGTVMYEQVARKDDSRKHDISGATFYGKKERELLSVVSADTLVFTTGEEQAKAVMGVRGGGASVQDNEGLKSALAAVSGGKALWGAVVLTDAMLKMGGGELAMAADKIKAGDRVAFSLDVAGDVVVRLAFIATDEARATELESFTSLGKLGARSAIEQLAGEQKADAEKVYDGLEITRDGATIKITLRVPEAIAKKYADMAKSQMN